MTTGQRPCRTSGVLTVKRRMLSSFDHVCRHYTLPKTILQGTVVVAEEDCANHGRSISRNGQASQ